MKFLLARLNYCWRILATGYCFAFFSLFGLLLAMTLLPLARLLARDPHEKNRRARYLVKRIWQFFVWQMKVLGLISVSVERQEILEQSAGKLVIANHPSLIDVVLLISIMPPHTCCVVKAELYRNFFIKGVIRAVGYISNSSADELLGGSQREFSAGEAIVVFPEGTRSSSALAPLKFQRGAANIAARCGADIIPVFIRCDPPTLRKGEPWYRIPDRRAHFTLTVQSPIRLQEGGYDASSPAKMSRELNRYLECYFTEGIKPYA